MSTVDIEKAARVLTTLHQFAAAVNIDAERMGLDYRTRVETDDDNEVIRVVGRKLKHGAQCCPVCGDELSDTVGIHAIKKGAASDGANLVFEACVDCSSGIEHAAGGGFKVPAQS